MSKIYDVALDNKSRYVDALFTYKSDSDLKIGDVVLVPFGMANKETIAIVVREHDGEKAIPRLKSIIMKIENAQDLTQTDVQTALFIKDEYMCSYYDALRLFLPPSGYGKRHENYTVNIELAKDKNQEFEEYFAGVRKNAKNKLLFLNELKKNGSINQDEFEKKYKIKVKQYIEELDENKLINILKVPAYEKNIHLTGENATDAKKSKTAILNPEQKKVYYDIISGYEKRDFTPVLLHGVTGSGKTAVYIEVVKYILSKGRRALILVPEISLTMQTINRFTDNFDEDIAVIHSGLTKRQRFDQWVKIKDGVSRIIIGARSALFSPIEDLGAVIIDECHDSSYKSEQSPKYDAVQLAQHIAEQKKALLILSSATPTISGYYYARQNRYRLLTIKNRANGLPLPSIEIVDMIAEMKTGNTTDISGRLREEMKTELAKGNQVLLFINKRGYSNNLTCDNCGHVKKCPDCDITLTYHKYDETLRCHYCGYVQRAEHTCEECGQGRYIMMTTGTQKVEIQVRSLFPSAKVFRLDKDTGNTKDNMYTILEDFRNENSAVLIGTQMIGKGHDFEKVTLVGIIDADRGMNSPAYNAYEKSFSTIEQVAGRAGRGDSVGRVIVQTYTKNNPIFYYIYKHDYENFYKDEIEKRKIYSYEPFGNLIAITVSCVNEVEAEKSAMRIKDALSFYNEKHLQAKLKVYNSQPCPVKKIDAKYRFRVVLRADNENLRTAKKMIDYTLTKKRKVVLTSDKVSVSVDVNPDNMI